MRFAFRNSWGFVGLWGVVGVVALLTRGGQQAIERVGFRGRTLGDFRECQSRDEFGLTFLLASAAGKPACQVKPNQKRRG